MHHGVKAGLFIAGGGFLIAGWWWHWDLMNSIINWVAAKDWGNFCQNWHFSFWTLTTWHCMEWSVAFDVGFLLASVAFIAIFLSSLFRGEIQWGTLFSIGLILFGISVFWDYAYVQSIMTWARADQYFCSNWRFDSPFLWMVWVCQQDSSWWNPVNIGFLSIFIGISILVVASFIRTKGTWQTVPPTA